MRRAVMLSGAYPCVRAGKMTEALAEHGWEHDAVCRMLPPQFVGAYRSVNVYAFGDRRELAATVKRLAPELVHVHNEPNWPVSAMKELTDLPVIMNVHDVSSARPGPFHPDEEAAYADADGFVFVTEQQREFCLDIGLPVEGKPYAVVGNWASRLDIVEKPVLPHIGGVVYMGGADPRGSEAAWRDMSPVADALKGELHIYPGNPGIDYGILHKTVTDAPVIGQRLAQHDWGWCGAPVPNEAWKHSLPNKLPQYVCAGVPFIAMNVDAAVPLAAQGYGHIIEKMDDLPRLIAAESPKSMSRKCREDAYRFTMAYHIEPVVELYEKVLGGTS